MICMICMIFRAHLIPLGTATRGEVGHLRGGIPLLRAVPGGFHVSELVPGYLIPGPAMLTFPSIPQGSRRAAWC